MKTFGKLVEEYRKSPHFGILAERSKEQYNRYLDRLLEIGSKVPMLDDMPNAVARSRSRKPLAKFWWESINNYETDDGEASATVKNMMLTILKVPYRWAVASVFEIKSNENPVAYIPRWTETIEPYNPYTPEEIKKVKQAVIDGLFPADVEPYAVLKVFAFHCGARPEEMFEHQISDFTEKQGEYLFQVYSAKGRQEGVVSREVIMGSEEKWALAYFQKQPVYNPDQPGYSVRGNGVENALYTFRTDKGKKFNRVTNWEKQIEVDTIAGIDTNHEFYDLRRGLATAMYKQGIDIRTIADRLGHKSVETTWRYIKLDATGRSLSSPYRGIKS